MARTPVQNIKRRGAVYWWRRTISLGSLAYSEKSTISLEFSLRTKELDSARGRAAAMTAHSERLRMSFQAQVAANGLGEEAIAALYVNEMRSYRNTLVHLEAVWKTRQDWRDHSTRHEDLQFYESLWSAIAEEGLTVPLDRDFVEKHFAAFGEEKRRWILGLFRDLRDFADTLQKDAISRLAELTITPNGLNTAVAVDTVARARAEAARRIRVRDFSELTELGPAKTYAGIGVAPVIPSAAYSHEPAVPAIGNLALTDEQQELLGMTPTEYAEIFLKDRFGQLDHRKGSKRQKRSVGESTYRDVRWACSLLEKSLPSGTPFAAITDDHLVDLDTWFDKLPCTIGKSPKHRDPATTLADIADEAVERVESGDLDAGDIGLSDNTTNKHWHNLQRMHEHLRAKVPHVPGPNFKRFITADDRDDRDAREKYSIEQGRAIFQLPPWTGCSGLQDRLTTGAQIIHDALFFVLLLVWYTGARREEICKLRIADLFLDCEVPHLYIHRTETGRVKTKSSRRKIPLHSELLRLGLTEYARAMEAAGETLLFPEIYPSGGTKRAIGDVFYKIWWLKIAPHVPNLKRGQAMHAARHSVSDALKQAGIDLEARNDFLGQSQKALGEGAARYSEPVALARMKDMVEIIPNITGHLADCKRINLIPAEQRVPRPSRRQ